LRGVGEFAQCRHLAVLDGEDMDPLGGELAASLLDGPGVVAHHEHLVAADVEFTRLEGVGLLQLADEAEEFLNAGRPLRRPMVG
jgi:hypothetical protein